MDYMTTDVANPFFYGYSMDESLLYELSRLGQKNGVRARDIADILDRYRTTYSQLSPQAQNIIDSIDLVD